METMFDLNNQGFLQAIRIDAYNEGKSTLEALRNFKNSKLKSSTQFIKKADYKELLESISRIHSPAIESKFKEKLDIIENSTTCDGDFIVIVDSVDQDYYKSRSTIILHINSSTVARTAASAVETRKKIYDVFMHSVSFEVTASVAQALIFGGAAISVLGGATALGFSTGTALAFFGVGIIYSAIHTKPKMPESIEHALNVLMVESLETEGWLIREGNRYILRKPSLEPHQPAAPKSSGENEESEVESHK